MSETFIENPIRLISNDKGPLLSDFSINLTFKALNCKDLDRDEEYHNSLTIFKNLTYFWKRITAN